MISSIRNFIKIHFGSHSSDFVLDAYADVWKTRRASTPANLIRAYKEQVFTCANINAQAVASASYHLYTVGKTGTNTKSVSQEQLRFLKDCKFLAPMFQGSNLVEITNHPLLDLLRSVNDAIDGFELFELTDLYQEMIGVSYWYIPPNTKFPEQIWILPSHQVMPVQDPTTGKIVRYEYNIGTKKENYSPDDILVFKFPSLTNPYINGRSPAQAAWETIGLIDADRSFTQAILKNRTRPDMILSPKDSIGKPEAERLRIRMNKQFARSGSGGMIIAESGMDVKHLAYPPKDMEAIARIKLETDVLYNIFGIPVALGQGNTLNRATLEAALFQHGKLTINPRLRRLYEKLNQNLVPRFGNNLLLWYDNPIPEDKKLTAQIRKVNVVTGVTLINEERAEDGKEPVAWGNKPWLDSRLAQPSDNQDLNERIEQSKPVTSEPKDDKPKSKDVDSLIVYDILRSSLPRKVIIASLVKHGVSLVRAYDWTDKLTNSVDDFQHCHKNNHRVSDSMLSVLRKDKYENKGTGHNRVLPEGSALEEILIQLFNKQRKELLNSFKVYVKVPSLIDTIDLSSYNEEFVEKLEPSIVLFVKEGAEDFVGRFSLDPFKMENVTTRNAIEKMTFNFARSTNEATSMKLNDAFSALRESLEGSLLTEGDVASELVKRIQGIFDSAEKHRATTIALTESSRALHLGQKLAAVESGVVKGFMWLLSSDPCSICLAINDKYPRGIPLEGNFGNVTDYADVTAHPAYNSIPHPPAHPNCECTITEVINEEALV